MKKKTVKKKKQSDSFPLVIKYFKTLGFKVLYQSFKDCENGPDMWFIKKSSGKIYSVEVKQARVKKDMTSEIDPISTLRKGDDFVAIVFEKYVLIEPMRDHLKLCSPGGTRHMTIMSSGSGS